MKNNEILKISVIVPIYNAELYLRTCIDSIVNQTYRNLEILLVDDGSTDSSLSICKEYLQKDDRIVVLHQDNLGLVAARKRGVNVALGDYIAFVDSDDYIDLDTYMYLVNCIENNPDIIAYGMLEEYTDHTVIKKNKFTDKRYERTEIEKKIFPGMLSYGSFFDSGILPNLVCKLIDRKFYQRISPDISNNITVGEDADATFQLLIQADTLQIVDYCPYHYCKRYDSMMWKPISQGSIDNLEANLRTAFCKSGYMEVMSRQLTEYITFVTLLKNPRSLVEDMMPFGQEGAKIALYGAGGFGQALYGEFYQQISVWVDRDFKKYRSLGLNVQCVDALCSGKLEYDAVFIAILNQELCAKIKEQLMDMGIQKTYYYGMM